MRKVKKQKRVKKKQRPKYVGGYVIVNPKSLDGKVLTE